MKKTILFSLKLLIGVLFVSSCGQNNEKKVFVKVTLANGWTDNPYCSGNFQQSSSICGIVTASVDGFTGGGSNLQLNQSGNELSKQIDEFVMDLGVNKNLQITVSGKSSSYVWPDEYPILVHFSNLVLMEVYVDGIVYDSRTISTDGMGTNFNYNVIVE